jgi:hypothetical protein
MHRRGKKGVNRNIKQKQIAVNSANEDVSVKALADVIKSAVKNGSQKDHKASKANMHKKKKEGKTAADANAGTGNNDRNSIDQRQTLTINSCLCCKKGKRSD